MPFGKKSRGQCGRARSRIPAGEEPTPARQASHREEDPGPAGVIPTVKHRGIETTGRKRCVMSFLASYLSQCAHTSHARTWKRIFPP